MLIPIMTFDIHNFQTNITESFVVENTVSNQDKVLSHRYTRNIKFSQMFSFQFDNEMRMPAEFIEMDTWARLLNSNPEMFGPALDLPVAALA